MCKESYYFEIEHVGKAISKHYSIGSAYDHCLSFVEWPGDFLVCEYRHCRLYYVWTLRSFLNYYKKISQ